MANRIMKIPGHQKLKNIGRSLGYAFVDAAGSLNPTLARAAKETTAVAKEGISTIRSINRDEVSQSIKDFLDPNGDNVIHNIIDDFKTGNWYNKERIDNAGFGDIGGDFDLDFEDWGDDSSSDDFDMGGGDDNTSTASTMISGMQNLSEDLAVSMGKTSAASAEYIAKSGHRDSLAVYDLTKTGFSNVSSLLMGINSKLDTMTEVMTPIATQSQNTFTFQIKASEFFETTGETLNKMNASLEQIAANTAVLNPERKIKPGRDKTLGSLLVGDEFDFSGYFDMIKANFKEQTDLVKSFADIGLMMGGKNLKNVSPLATAMVYGIKKLVPETIKESMKEMNTVFEGAIPALLRSLKEDAEKNGGFLKGLLADIFLPDMSLKKGINKGKYEKGPVAWDGIARKSLVEVIPTYLAKIYGALGGEELYYDFNRGTFTSTAAIANGVFGKKVGTAVNAAGDIKTKALTAVGTDKRKQEEILNFFVNSLEDPSSLNKLAAKRNLANTNDREFEKFVKDLGLSRESAKALISAVTGSKPSELMKYTLAMNAAQSNMNKYYEQEEKAGHSNLNYLDNGFTVTKDKFGKSQSEYLRDIYQMVGNIYAKMGGQGNIFDVSNPSRIIVSGSREKSNMDRNENKVSSMLEDMNAKTLMQFGMSQEDIEAEKEREKWKAAAEKTKTEAISRIKKVKEWIKTKTPLKHLFRNRGNEGGSEDDDPNSLSSRFKSFTEKATDILDTITAGISDLFWGENDQDKGIIDRIKDKISDAFASLKDNMTNFFKEKVWEPIKGFASNTIGSVVRGFKTRGRQKYWMGQGRSEEEAYELAQIDVFNAEREKKARKLAAKTEPVEPPVEGAARGRKVTRTGLIAVSEGELIIPSEFNPFYKGYTNKKQQIRNEQSVINKFYGGYADGGTVGGRRYIKTARETLSQYGANAKERAQNFGGYARDMADQAAESIGSGVSRFLSAIAGNFDQKSIDDQKKKVNEGIKKVFEDMGEHKSAMAIGALGGVGVSLLTGAFIGPIAGAAIGAGVGLISKSNTLQKLLFGEVVTDENGNFVSDDRTALGRAKDFIIEGAANILNKAKQKVTPEMIAGAGLGAFIGGPFGIVGGALMGGAAGFLATNEQFKLFMFGDGTQDPKEDDSFTGLLRNKVFSNLDEIFHNTGSMLKGLFKDLGTELSGLIKHTFEDIRAKAMRTRLGQKAAAAGKALGNLAKMPIRALGGALGGVNRGLQRFNLRRGYNIYNRDEKRYMSAAERIARRDELGGFTGLNTNNFDEAISGMTDEELLEFENQIRATRDQKYSVKQNANDQMEYLYKQIDKNNLLRGNARKKFDNLVRAGRADEAIAILRENGINGFDNLVSSASDNITGGRKNARSLINKYHEDIEKRYNIRLGTDVKRDKALELLEAEKKARGVNIDEITAEKEEDEKEKQVFDYQGSVIGLMSGILATLNNARKKIKPEKLVKGIYKHVSSYKEFANIGGGASEKVDEGTEKTVHTPYGIKRISVDPNTGEEKERTDDKETDETQKRQDSFFKNIAQLSPIAAGLSSIKGLFTNLHDKLFGSKDDPEKKGLFGTLFEYISGKKDSVMSKIGEFMTGTTIGSFMKTVAGNLSVKNLLKGGLGVLAIAALSGAFDNFFQKLGNLPIFRGNDTKSGFSGDELTETTVDPETGETTTTTKYAGFDNRLSTSLKRNMLSTTIRGLAKGKSIYQLGGVVGGALRKGATNLSEGLLKGTRIGKGLGNLTRDLTEKGILEVARTGIANACENLPAILNKIPFLPRALKGEGAEMLATSLFTHLDDALKSAGKTVGKFLTKVADLMPLINIAYSVVVGINAWGNAESILGITDRATFGQKCIATLIAVVNSLIPFVGDLIPNNVLVNIFMAILPKIGIDVSSLQEQRDEAAQLVAEYNAQNGTDYSIAQYNEIVQGRAGIFTKAGHAIKNTFSGLKTTAANFASTVATHGLGNAAQMAVDKVNETEPTTKIGKIAKGAWDVFAGKIAQMGVYVTKGDVAGLWKYDIPNTSGTGVETMLNGVLGIWKLLGTPVAAVTYVGTHIGEIFTKIANKIKDTISLVTEGVKQGYENMHDPEQTLHDMFTVEDDPENPMSGFAKAITIASRVIAIPITMAENIGKLASKAINAIVDPIKQNYNEMLNVNAKLKEEASTADGSIINLLKIQAQSSYTPNGLEGVFKFGAHVSLIAHSVGLIIRKIGNTIGEWIEPVIAKVKSDSEAFHSAIDRLKNKDSDSSTETNLEPHVFNSILGGFYSFGLTIAKIVYKIKDIINPIVEFAKDAGGFIADKAKNFFEDKVAGAYNITKSMSQSLSGGSSFINQRSNAYAGQGFAGSTFADKGCGPAVASMTASALGKSLPLGKAVRGSRGYQNAVGVDAGYFGDVLGQSGIPTQYVSGAGAVNQLAAGNKVILLGQDARNTSKSKSPFGPGNHYVLATGMRNGKVMINDPENNGPRAYNPSILNNVRMGIAAGSSYIRRLPIVRLFSGAGSQENISQIWGFLKSKGLSDVAAAGLMGCWEAESSNSPDTLEGNYALKANSNEAMGSVEASNAYTERLFGLYDKNGMSINKKGYMGADGNYYPGYGLAQWTGPRQYNLVQWAKQNNMDHRQLATQLEYFWTEYQNRPKLQQALANAKSVEEATAAALDYYEMSEGWHTKPKGQEQLAKRLGHANSIFNMMNGQAGTLPVASSGYSRGSTGSTASDSSDLSVGGIFNLIGNFQKLWGEAFGGLLGNASSSSSQGGAYNSASSGSAVQASLSGSPSEILRSIIGKVKYDMNGPRNPELGSADCSSTVQWAIKKAGGPDIGSNTGMQYNNSNLTPIWYGNGQYAQAIDGLAQKDDVMFFARPGKSSDKGAALDHVGHVGLYLGNNQYIDHGSGMGPRIKDFSPSSNLIKISRITGLGIPSESAYTPTHSQEEALSGIANIRANGPITNQQDAQKLVQYQQDKKYYDQANTLSGGASGMFDVVGQVGSTISNIAKPSNETTTPTSSIPGQQNNELTELIQFIKEIRDNTAWINKIFEAIKVLASGGDSQVQNTTSPGAQNNTAVNIAGGSGVNVSQDLVNLVGTLAALAKG